jgi:hypothetical protein
LKKIAVSLALIASLAFAANAQSFAIDWFTIDGGGGISSGGGFTLSGTIGQWDAGGTMTGGGFALTGGFWALPIAVATLDAPTLGIVPAGPGQATISWNGGGPGFVLQVSDDGYTWSDAPSGVANPATVPATFPIQLYRLRRP